MKTVSKQLRDAIERSGQSQYEIAKQTGVNRSVLSRFVASGHGLRSHNVDALCTYLRLELQQVRTPPIPLAESRNADAGGRGMQGASPSPKARARGKNSKATTKTTKAGTARKGVE
ncbi:hypothetical protein LBMAG48_23990 [Phycisphaerae bacterium]|nr:hypothetical protein LBMAG48_23990 [Phycisphaerae bacterium]